MFASGTQLPLCIIYIQYSLEFYAKRAKTLKNTKKAPLLFQPPLSFLLFLRGMVLSPGSARSVPGCTWCCCHLGLRPILIRMSHLRVLHSSNAVPPVCALEMLSLDTQKRTFFKSGRAALLYSCIVRA